MTLSPFRSSRFYDMHTEMPRLFDDMLNGMFRRVRDRDRSGLADWAPVLDVFTRNGDLVVKAELPGVKSEDIDITVQNGVLTISGERRQEREEDAAGYYVRERRYGGFRRSMSLPEGVDEDHIRARFEDGVLEVTIEGVGAIQEPRRIQIEGPSEH